MEPFLVSAVDSLNRTATTLTLSSQDNNQKSGKDYELNKLIIALGLTLAASTGAFAATTALDAYDVPANDGTAAISTSGVSNDLVSYDRAGKDGSPIFAAPQGDIDYTATASTGGDASSDQISYDRAGQDGSPSFVR